MTDVGNEMKHWYAIYTKPRWEKKVHAAVQTNGMESYCPLNRVRKKWSDRYRVIEEPLFKSYVFVKLSEAEKSQVRFINGVVNFVYWLGKPAQIKEADIVRIKHFLNEHNDVFVENLVDPLPGDQVVVTAGAFMERQGIVLSIDKRRVEIRIESLGCKLIALVDKTKVVVKN